MSETVGQFILRRLHEWGVDRIYGYPGDGINGLLGAFHEWGDKVEFVQVRHEEIASFAAAGHAKLTGRVGVCMATSGPGAIQLLNGLYDAKLDHTPIVAIVGQQKRMSIGGDFQQEVDLAALYKDVAQEYVQVLMAPEQTRHLVDRAMRIAAATRSPTCIIVPDDIQEAPFEDPPRVHGAVYSSSDFREPVVVPHERDLQAAADILNAGEKVAILAGAGARGAGAELERVADALGAGVAKALNGRDVLPDDLPFVTGPIGLLGSKPSDHMIENCDTFLMVGTAFPYSEWLPQPGQARAVQIDIDGRKLGIRYPTEVNLAGDAQATLAALLPLLERKAGRSWREEIEHEVDRWWSILHDQAMVDANPVNPQRVFHEMSQRLPDNVVLTADTGSVTDWWARHLRLRRGMNTALSGTLATMCPSIPYALAAKFAYPDRPVIATIGDGGFQMLGMNALLDIAKYADRFPNKQLITLVLNNGDLNQVTWEQRVLAGDAKLEASQVLPEFPYARYAELLGLKGIKADTPDAVGPAWDEALAADRPCVLEVVTDPEVPPLPPHIRSEQAKKFLGALRQRDPASGQMVKEAIKGKLQEFVNR